MIIKVNYDQATNTLPTGFTAGIATAVATFEKLFTDPITITIDVGYGEVEGQALTSPAHSIFNQTTVSYATLREAMVEDASDSNDKTAVANLPSADPFGPGDTIAIAQAEAKALGISVAAKPVDGYIGFESGDIWDYNSTDGVGAGLDDFVSAAEHEISEVLGRDADVGKTLGAVSDLYMPMDLFRYQGVQARQLTMGDPSYFSIDGGVTNLDPFNNFVTGDPNGDRRDWGTGAGDDAFNAVATPGVKLSLSSADLTLMDVLGYNVVVPTLSINPIEGTDWITPTEADAGVTISGNTNVETGRIVTVKIVNSSNVTVDTLTGAVSNGAWAVNLTSAQANALIGGAYTVKADATDKAGVAAPEATQTIGYIDVTMLFNGHAGTSDWTTQIDGDDFITNWSSNDTPGPGYDVEIGPGAPSVVTIDSASYTHTPGPLEVAGLVVDSGITLDENAGPLTIDTILDNSGQINVYASALVVGAEVANSGQIALQVGADLQLAGNVVLDGSGSLYLAGGNIDADDTLNTTLVNDSTIEGYGGIADPSSVVFTQNNGVVDGNDGGGALTIQGASLMTGDALTNEGTLEASNGASLSLIDELVLQTGGGVISADGDDSHVDLSGSEVLGGLFSTTDDGVVQATGALTIDSSSAAYGVAINKGTLRAINGGDLTLKGSSFQNDSGADIEILSEPGISVLTLDSGGVTFEGGGAILMNDSMYNSIVGGTLTNVDNLIAGSGTISTDIVNEAGGTIATYTNAFDPIFDSVNNTMILDGASIVNAGFIYDQSVAHIVLSHTTVYQLIGATYGRIISAFGAVDLQSATIEGGSLNGGGGVIETVDAGSVLDSTTAAGAVSNIGALALANGDSLTIKGVINNSGTITIHSEPYITQLIIDPTAGATLDGKGAVTMNDSMYNGIVAASGTKATFTNVDNTISGAGSFTNLTVVNQTAGVIDATGVNNQIVFDGTDVLQNHGLVEATGAAGLALENQTINSVTGGKILAGNGSHVDLYTDTLIGMTLATAGTGAWMVLDAGTILDGSTTSGGVTNASTLALADGYSLTIKGAIHNSGTITIHSEPYITQLIIDPTAGATLDGKGKVTMNDSMYNGIVAVSGTKATFTNVDNTISGAGSFTNLTVVNQTAGVIDATGVNNQIVFDGTDVLQNHGLVEATGAAGLALKNQTINSATGGEILAGNGSQVDLATDTLIGITLATAGTGAWMVLDNGTTLDGSTTSGGVTNASTLALANGDSLTIKGAIHNSGTITIHSEPYITQLIIDPTAGATLDGKGKVTMNDSMYNGIVAVSGTKATFTNVDNTISGAGSFTNLTVVNQTAGVIDATGVNNQIVFDGTDVLQNHGLVEATGVAGLAISDEVIDNSGGLIQVGASSKVILASDLIKLGVVRTIGSGVIEIADSGTLFSAESIAQGLTLAAKIQVDDGQMLSIAGSVVNNGAILVGVAGAASLQTGVTLYGSGSITLFDNAATTITGGFNNVSNTIKGAGTITAAIQQQAGGIIEATATDNALILDTGLAIANAGVLEANGGELIVDDAVTGAGHGIVTAGGELTFASSFDQNVTFQGAGVLALSQATYAGVISGLAIGDKIDLSGLVFAAGAVATATGGVLTVTSGSATEKLKLAGAPPTGFIVEADGVGGSLVTAAAAATVAQFQTNQATLDAIPTGFVIADTAANVTPALDSLNTDLHIASITLTDSGVPTLALAAATVANDTRALGEITNQNLAIAVTDTAVDVANAQAALNANAHVTSISISGGTGALNGVQGVNAASLSISGASAAVSLSSALSYAGAFSLGGGAKISLTGGALSLSGKANFAGGLVSGANTLSTTLSATVAGLTLAGGASWSNSGAVSQAGGALTLGDASTSIASLVNTATGSYSLGDDFGITRGAAAGSNINNAGLFAKTAGSGVSVIAASFVDTGTVTAASGTLAFSGPFNSFAGTVNGAGAVQFAAGATTIASGAKLAAANWSVTGTGTTATFNESLAYGGAFTLGAGATLRVAAGNVFSLTGAASLAGAVTGLGGFTTSGGATTLVGGASISTATWTISGAKTLVSFSGNSGFAGVLTLGAGATASVAALETLTLRGTSNLSGVVSGAGTLTLAGGQTTLLKGASVGIANLSLQTGGMASISENLNYAGSLSTSRNSTIMIDSGDTLALSGATTLAGAVGGAGVLVVAGATTTLNAGANLTVADLVVKGTGTHVSVAADESYAGTLNEAAGTTIGVAAGDALATTGAVTFGGTVSGAGRLVTSGGSTSFGAAAAISVAQWNIAGGTTVARITSPTLAYDGALTLETGATIAIATTDKLQLTGTSTITGGTIAGLGALALAGGATTISGGGLVNVASWTVAGGTTTIAKNLAYGGAFTAEGGATLTLSGAGAALSLTGHAALTFTTINGAGALTTSAKTGSVSTAGLTLGGTVVWTDGETVTQNGGNLTLGDSSNGAARLNLTTTGVYDITDDTGIALGGTGASSITNSGALEKTAGAGVSVIAAGITNSGLISATSGTLDLHGSIAGPGVDEVGGGATLQFDGSVAATQTVKFATGGGEVSLDDLHVAGVQLFHATLSGWAAGDSLDLGTTFGTGTTFNFVENSGNASGVLHLTDGTATAAIAFAGDFSNANFTPSVNASGATVLTFHA